MLSENLLAGNFILGGFARNNTSENWWPGKELTILNNTGSSVNLQHIVGFDEPTQATFRGDFLLKNNETAKVKVLQDGDLLEVMATSVDISGKLDKPLSPYNISTRVINADNSTSDKGEFQQSEQIEINTSQVTQASWRGKEVWITASCTLTIPDPTTLLPFWSIDIFVLSGTLTHAITSPATWIGTAPSNTTAGSYYRIVRRGNTNTFKVLGL